MSRLISNDSDGVLRRHTYAEPDGGVSTCLSQPNRDALMRDNQQRRLELVGRRLEWGRVELNIPELDMYALKIKYPDLKAPDAETRNRAWQRFIASSESTPYKVR